MITFDRRGTGLSDRSLGFGSLEERTADIRAVMDAAGVERAFLMGVSEGGPMSIVFAASSPERVQGLLLYGAAARFSQAEGHPWGLPPERIEPFVGWVRAKWGTGGVFSRFIQHASDPEATGRLVARFERNACTPQMAAEIMRCNLAIHVRALLSAITTPTVVVHATGDRIAPIESGRYLAEHVRGARMVELAGDYHVSWRREDMALTRDAVLDFLAEGGAPLRPVTRVLATVLFTDIVGSTTHAARVGDDAWRALLDRHDSAARTEIERHGGRIVNTTGDGVLATFDGPGRGIACARRLSETLLPLELRIRAGVHTGEAEVRGDDVAGMGVVIARRICDLAGEGEVLVSRTVKDLVAGSGMGLADRGVHELKGVPDEWRLFAAT